MNFFTSNAQNFEDVMLWRALGHIEKGFYIDVGANDPVVDSVTLSFYQRGWRGVNVEPMRQYYDKLRAQRPADITLQVAAGSAPDTLAFFDVADTGLSTLDAGIAAQHSAAGRCVVRRQVPVLPLSDICARHVDGPIHFLKIDVEGFEEEVLLGMDLRRWRPWILLVEATRPNSSVQNQGQWEQLVLSAGYQWVYFDGLNNFYVADEQAELIPRFNAPPNFFDGFKLCYGHWYSWPVDGLEDRVRRAEDAERLALEQKHAAETWAEARAVERSQQAAARAREAEAKLEAEASHTRLQEERAVAAERLAQEQIARALHAEALVQREFARANTAEDQARHEAARVEHADWEVRRATENMQAAERQAAENRARAEQATLRALEAQAQEQRAHAEVAAEALRALEQVRAAEQREAAALALARQEGERAGQADLRAWHAQEAARLHGEQAQREEEQARQRVQECEAQARQRVQECEEQARQRVQECEVQARQQVEQASQSAERALAEAGEARQRAEDEAARAAHAEWEARHAEELTQRANGQEREQAARASHAEWLLKVERERVLHAEGIIRLQEARAQQAEAQVVALGASLSWRVTKPLRLFSHGLARLKSGLRALPGGCKKVCKKVFVRCVLLAGRHPWLMAVLRRNLARFPALNARVRAMFPAMAHSVAVDAARAASLAQEQAALAAAASSASSASHQSIASAVPPPLPASAADAPAPMAVPPTGSAQSGGIEAPGQESRASPAAQPQLALPLESLAHLPLSARTVAGDLRRALGGK